MSKLDMMKGCQRSLQCYRCQRYGHRPLESLTKVNPSNDHKSLIPVSQSHQKKSRAMVDKSQQDVERPRSSGRLISSGETIYSAACHAQSNDGQIYIRVGWLNGRPVKVLRDTGYTLMIVERVLIPDSMMIPGSSGSLQMIDHTLIDVPLANVYLDSLYYKRHCKVMCVSSPVYPVVIGNVRGALQMLPHPDWNTEDKRRAQARTSGATTMTVTTKVVICLVGSLKRSPTDKKLRI